MTLGMKPPTSSTLEEEEVGGLSQNGSAVSEWRQDCVDWIIASW